MNNLSQYIAEKLKINSNTVKQRYKYYPKNKDELHSIIKNLLKERGHDADLNDIDTSEITDMSYLFSNLNFIDNIDISRWDVSNVTNMKFMFYGCENFNCDLSDWDVSKVTKMRCMFYNCENFNSDLNRWKVSKVEIMDLMFNRCDSLKNKPSWYKK